MDLWQGLALLAAIHVLAALSPGPDLALMTRQALVHGRRAAYWTSLGISAGLSVHICYSVAGLAALIAHSAQWMVLFRFAGGCYLIALGISTFRSRGNAANGHTQRQPQEHTGDGDDGQSAPAARCRHSHSTATCADELAHGGKGAGRGRDPLLQRACRLCGFVGHAVLERGL